MIPASSNTLPWEGNLVEGPWVVPRSPYVYVIYSANAFYNASYAMGVARAPINSFLGPYTKFPDPLVHSNNVWIGPGHCSVVSSYVDPARTFLVYHSYKGTSPLSILLSRSHTAPAGEVGGNYNRVLLVDELKWDDVNRWPYVTSDSPSIVPQRLPIRN